MRCFGPDLLRLLDVLLLELVPSQSRPGWPTQREKNGPWPLQLSDLSSSNLGNKLPRVHVSVMVKMYLPKLFPIGTDFFKIRTPLPRIYFTAKYGLPLKNLATSHRWKNVDPEPKFNLQSLYQWLIWEDFWNYSGMHVQQHTMYKLHTTHRQNKEQTIAE